MRQHLTEVFPMPKSFKDEVGQNFELKGSWWNGVTGAARNVLHLCIVTSYDDEYQWNRPIETGAIYFQAENRSEEDEDQTTSFSPCSKCHCTCALPTCSYS